MRWKKLGKIFDPADYKLLGNYTEFAQSPQALVFDDFIRIYFSTREMDSTGMYLSHIAFVDMDNNFKLILRLSQKPVISLGNSGCYDEHGIFPMNVTKIQNRIFGYICGWSRKISVPIETSIGISESKDNGETFYRLGDGPVLTSSLNEPFLVGDPFVSHYEGLYHMWYIYGVRWIEPVIECDLQRIYKIGHATSHDGINWIKEGRQILTDFIGPEECQALPTVTRIGNLYTMFFCYRYATDFRKNKDRGYRLGFAYSRDLTHWTRDDANIGIDKSQEGWDSEMMCYPHIFKSNDNIYLLYNGNDFGRAGFGIAVMEKPPIY